VAAGANRCPSCDAELSADSPAGLCPRCVIRQGTTVAPSGPADVDAATDPGTTGPARSPEPTKDDSKATGAFVSGSASADRTIDHTPSPRPNDPTRTATDRDEALAAGTTVRSFGDYEIQKELGRGGMGVVYQARQISLNRPVALKMIKAGLLAGSDELRRFQNEAEAVALLDHPSIVPVYEVGCHDGQHYFSMKLVPGGSLAPLMDRYRKDPRAAAILVAEAAEAVAHAHARGILHRDIKPANILVDDRGRPFVTDFGLAKRVDGDSELTHSGAILGTPAYMAPEQASGRRGAVTTATDVYGLGSVLYALLTGRPPFSGDSAAETLERVRAAAPVPPSKINPRAPRDLEVICLKCLEKDPQRRYASAQALADDLGHYLADEPITARPVGRAERAQRWCRRNPVVAGLGVGIALVLVLGTVVATSFAVRASRSAAKAMANLELAKEEARRANEATDRAIAEAGRADREAQRVRDEKRLSDHRLYIAEMSLAQQDWQESDMHLLRQRLEAQKPRRPDDPDFRGFEWYYLARLGGLELRTMRGHPYPVVDVAYSPDGRTLASAGQGRIVKLWETATGAEIRTLHISANALAYSPDGRTLASAGFDKMVKLWEAATGAEIRTLRGHADSVEGVAYSPDGRTLASASRDRTVRLWDAATGAEIRSLSGHVLDVRAVAYSPDGHTLASAGADKTVRLWDAATGAAIRTLVTPAEAVAYSPDGRTLASISDDNTVRLWDAATGAEIRTLRGRGDARVSYGVAYSPDGRILAGGGRDCTLWDAATGQEILTLRGTPRRVAFSPDSRRIATVDFLDRSVKLWGVNTSQEVSTLRGHTSWILGIAFSPDSRTLASASEDKTVRLWDTDTGREIRSLNGHASIVYGVAYSPDGHTLASASFDQTVRLWDAATGAEIRTLRGHEGAVEGVAYSPDGRTLASAGWDRTVKLWDAATGAEIRTLRGHSNSVADVAFSPDGRTLASAGWDRTVKLWDAATGAEIRTLRGHGDSDPTRDSRVRAVAYSADGRTLASASDDATVRLWDAATGAEIRTLRHASGVWGVAFSPDGLRIVSAGSAPKLWDTVTGREILALRGHGSAGLSVAYSPNGRFLASPGWDHEFHTVKLWDSRPLTPELRVTREARGVVDFLLAGKIPVAEIPDRIHRDPTISDEVRRRALAYLNKFHLPRSGSLGR
jgi:eukaryotic-like serine/threonine-protein kinase